MITRSHNINDTVSTATYSDCERYRYSLKRVWDPAGKRLGFVMLNPSKATEVQNDPTVERCQRRARKLGYGAFEVTNIFAWRETHPKLMRKASDPVGPGNNQALLQSSAWADALIAAWGVHGDHQDRGPKVLDLLRDLDTPVYHLGLTKAGHPRHPLYCPYAQQPIAWQRPHPC